MTDLSWSATVRLVHERADACCEYCQTCQSLTGQAMHVEHIIPNGDNHPDNLCLSCANCNQSKSAVTIAVDPLTQKTVTLFNPRQDLWSKHFEWDDSGTRIHGKTATGRATIDRLKMNIDRVVLARRNWVRAGGHPPGRKTG